MTQQIRSTISNTNHLCTICLSLWILLLLTFSCTANAATNGILDRYTVQFDAYVDNSAQKTIQDIARLPESAFKTASPAGYAGGYNRAIHWLKFTLYPLQETSQKVWLRITPTYLDYITLYIPDRHGHFNTIESGELSDTRKIKKDRAFTFAINNVKQPTTAYLRIEANNSHTVIADVYTDDAYHQALLFDYTFSGIFIGLLFTLVIINLLYIKWTRERNFRYYFNFVLASLVLFLDTHGWFALLAPANWNVWMNYLPQFTTLFYMSSLALFYHYVFNFKRQTNAVYFWISGGYLALTFVGFLSLAVDLYIEFMRFLMPLSMIYLLLITGFACRLALSKKTEGRLLFLAVVFGLGGLIGNVLSLSGLISGGYLLRYSYTAGTLASIIVFQSIIHRRIRIIEDNHVSTVLEKEHAQEMAQKERAEKQQKAQFLSMLSHELKTPLSIIKMGVEQHDISDKFRQYMIQAANDMSLVIDRCSVLEKVDSKIALNTKQVNLISLLENMTYKNLSSARIELIYPDVNAEIQTDEDWLKIIVSNLLDNALKYSPAESSVSIKLRQDAQKWCISVENWTTETLPTKEQIFKKYYRSESAHRQTGSGLGLYIVKRLTSQLHGSIEYIPVQSPDLNNKKVIFRLCLNTTI